MCQVSTIVPHRAQVIRTEHASQLERQQEPSFLTGLFPVTDAFEGRPILGLWWIQVQLPDGIQGTFLFRHVHAQIASRLIDVLLVQCSDHSLSGSAASYVNGCYKPAEQKPRQHARHVPNRLSNALRVHVAPIQLVPARNKQLARSVDAFGMAAHAVLGCAHFGASVHHMFRHGLGTGQARPLSQHGGTRCRCTPNDRSTARFFSSADGSRAC